MLRSTILMQVAAETGIIQPAEMGRVLARYHSSGSTRPFDTWALEASIIDAPAMMKLLEAFEHTTWRCISCSTVASGSMLVPGQQMRCPACNSAALKREREAVQLPPRPDSDEDSESRTILANRDVPLPGERPRRPIFKSSLTLVYPTVGAPTPAPPPQPPSPTGAAPAPAPAPLPADDSSDSADPLRPASGAPVSTGSSGSGGAGRPPQSVLDDPDGDSTRTARNKPGPAGSATTHSIPGVRLPPGKNAPSTMKPPSRAGAPQTATPVNRHGGPDDSLELEELPVEELRLSNWRIVRFAGRGAMGSVWQAYNDVLDHYAAVKVLETDKPSLAERFRLEARACARLDHPNIIRIRDFGSCQGKPCIVMDWVDGGALDGLLAREKLLPLSVVLDVGIQCAEGLAVAHAAGIVHRDVKPGNVMRGHDGRLKVTDFGLARVRDIAIRLTSPGQVVGTPAYMAPEQITADEVSPATDIYSLGAMLFHLATGTKPFDAAGWRVMVLHTTQPFPSAREVRPELPRAFDELLKEMCAKKPRQRPVSMDDVADRLREIAGQPLRATALNIPRPQADKPDEPGVDVITIGDRLDSHGWLQIEVQVEEIRQAGTPRIIVDLGRCERINSSGLAAMVRLADDIGEDGFMLAAVQPGVNVVLEMMGMHNYFRIAPTVQEAVDLLGGGPVRKRRPTADPS